MLGCLRHSPWSVAFPWTRLTWDALCIELSFYKVDPNKVGIEVWLLLFVENLDEWFLYGLALEKLHISLFHFFAF